MKNAYEEYDIQTRKRIAEMTQSDDSLISSTAKNMLNIHDSSPICYHTTLYSEGYENYKTEQRKRLVNLTHSSDPLVRSMGKIFLNLHDEADIN